MARNASPASVSLKISLLAIVKVLLLKYTQGMNWNNLRVLHVYFINASYGPLPLVCSAPKAPHIHIKAIFP